MEDKTFYPEQCGITKSRIVELLNNAISDHTIKIDDPRLTDGLCQEIVNSWADQEVFECCPGDLWESADDLSEEWETKLSNIFGPQPPKVPTFKPGDIVIFNDMGMAADFEYPEDEMTPEESIANITMLNGQKAKIDSLDTYVELGNKDHEYYNITFLPPLEHREMFALSGYHLTLFNP